MSKFTILELPTVTESRGSLTILQDALPFSIRRVFWITGADHQTRGGHRHRRTRQALAAVAGTVVVHLDDGVVRSEIRLERPNQCLIVEPEDWHAMDFSAAAVLMVFASEPYDADDYIVSKCASD